MTVFLPTVYIDTTIPSYYHEKRTDPLVRSRHLTTVRWWDLERERYRLYISEPVLDELSSGDYPRKVEVERLVADIEVLQVEESIIDIARHYIEKRVMPRGVSGDAIHLAFASFYRLDYLLTWNCRHLANARKFRHIRMVNGQLGLQTPDIVTPEQLFLEEDLK